MRPRLFAAILSATSVYAFAGALPGDDAPQMTEISQKAAKPGEIITVSGLGLSTKNVDEVYLTDHKFDMRVKVLEQNDKAVKFRVPPFAKPGRMQLLFLSKGDQPKLLEQPVYLLIEDPDAEIVATSKPAPAVQKVDAPAKTEEKAEPVKTETAKPDSTKENKTEQKPDTKQEPRPL